MNSPNNNKDRKIIDELNALGSTLRSENENHRNTLRDQLRQNVPQREDKPTIFRIPHLGRVLIPTLSIAAIAVIVLVSAAYRPAYYDAETYILDDIDTVRSESALSTSSTMSYSDSTGMATPTFKSRFLQNIGRHEVSQDRVNSYREVNGDFFEQDVRFNLLSSKNDAFDDVMDIYVQLDGYIGSSNGHGTKSFTLTGAIPQNNLTALRNELREYVGSDNFILETNIAQNRVKDVITIDEKIRAVEDAIVILEGRLAAETDAEVIKKLNEELIQHNAYLKERIGTKDTLLERVDYVDVSLTVTKIKNWLNAESYWELKQAISGYDSPGFGERLIINVAYVITRIILFVSYTFWIIIPFAIWWIFRRKRNSLFAGLD